MKKQIKHFFENHKHIYQLCSIGTSLIMLGTAYCYLHHWTIITIVLGILTVICFLTSCYYKALWQESDVIEQNLTNKQRFRRFTGDLFNITNLKDAVTIRKEEKERMVNKNTKDKE